MIKHPMCCSRDKAARLFDGADIWTVETINPT
jgi:hypothetical protein